MSRWPFTISVILVLTLCTQVRSQDILGIFFNNGGESGMMGGDPFAEIGTNRTHHLYFHDAYTTPLVRFDSHIDNVYKETRSDGTENGLQRNLNLADVVVPLTLGSRPIVFRASARSTTVSGSIDLDAEQHASYNGRDEYVSAAVQVPVSDAMNWTFAMGENTQGLHTSPGYETGFSYEHPEGTTTLSLRNRPNFQVVGLNIAGVDGVLPLDFSQKGAEVSFDVPFRRLVFHMTGHDDFIVPLPAVDRINDTRFAPNGKAWGFTFSTLAEISSEVDLLFSCGSESIDGKGTFTSRMSPYAQLDKFSLYHNFIRTGIRYAVSAGVNLESDISWSRINGAAAGFAESWPFVSIKKTSLSQGYFDGSGTVRLTQAHLGGIFSISERFHAGCGINVVRMIPDASLVTWQSRFLSFGERDRKTMTFPFRELRGLILSGGIKGSVGVFGLLYSFSQIVPLKAVTILNEQHGESSPGTILAPAIHGSGGQFHSLSILLYL